MFVQFKNKILFFILLVKNHRMLFIFIHFA